MRCSYFITLIALLLIALPVCARQAGSQKEDSQAAAAAFEQGQNAQQRGDLSAAVRYYTNAINAAPSLYQPYYQRATALMAQGHDKEAEADLRKVVALKPDFARAYRGLGQVLLDRDATDEAKAVLARALELDPKITGVRLLYGSALIKTNEPQKALEPLRAAVETGEATALVYALLGIAEERTGKPDAAFADFSKAIEMDASIAAAHEGRARYYEAHGDWAKAIADYCIAYRTLPSQDIALRLTSLYTRTGQPQAAMQIYRVLLTERPNDLALRTEVIRLMIDNGQTEEAAKEINGLVKLRPNDPKVLVMAGDMVLKEKPEEAAAYYRHALEINAHDNHARIQLGTALVHLRQFEPAINVLTEALQHDAGDYNAHASLATAFFELKQYPQAAEGFIWLIRQKPDVPVSYYFLAISFDKLGDCPQAMKAYQEFMRRADVAVNKLEVDNANYRSSQLARLMKDGKCKPPQKGK
jgi:protein O-GlcNAc transferase